MIGPDVKLGWISKRGGVKKAFGSTKDDGLYGI